MEYTIEIQEYHIVWMDVSYKVDIHFLFKKKYATYYAINYGTVCSVVHI
jgi:hypothetical protein